MKRNDRAIEISRLIGRSLRAITNLAVLGERTIMVDCDVLQADGSTRTAAITGACLALQQAMINWIAAGDIQASLISEPIAAVSVGSSSEGVLLDLDYQEDSSLDADYNVILTAAGTIIEIQGTAEKRALSWEQFEQMMVCARAGVAQMFEEIQKQAQSKENVHSSRSSAAMFSLHSRLKSVSE
jgi:ribonuclease PH